MTKEAKKGDVIPLRGQVARITRTRVDTIEFSADDIKKWKKPLGVQRELTVNGKVKALAETIRDNDGVIPGMLTLGILDGDTYIVDGQHRLYSFSQSGCAKGYADVRYCYFDSMAELGNEFASLNTPLARMKPDDYLRALEHSIPAISTLRKNCQLVSFAPAKNSGKVSMSSVLRAWRSASRDTPSTHGCADTATDIISSMDETTLGQIASFLKMCEAAWGKAPEYTRLWGSLNMTLCMWLYQRTVMRQFSVKSAKLDDKLFGKCLMALSADPTYVDWLRGRTLGERNRGPAYDRIKQIFVRRLHEETRTKMSLPAPDWPRA